MGNIREKEAARQPTTNIIYIRLFIYAMNRNIIKNIKITKQYNINHNFNTNGASLNN